MWSWLQPLEADLIDILGKNLILFGEWCYAQHSLPYHDLPSWFIGFDIYDRSSARFYSVARRNEVLELLDLPVIHPLSTGKFSMKELYELLEKPSCYGSKVIEGVYLRADEEDWLKQRAKLVRADFTQAIDEHWSRKGIIPNSVTTWFR